MLRVLAIAELCIFLSYQLWLQFDDFGESETNDAIDDPIFLYYGVLWSTIPGPRHNIKIVFPSYGDSHVKDKTIVTTSAMCRLS